MKKRIFLFAAALLMLLLPLAASAENAAVVKDKLASRSGPGTKYTEELGTVDPGTQVTVLSQAENNGTKWYHVEFTRSGSTYRCYILPTRIEVDGPISWEENDYLDDVTVSRATAYYGPGEQYAIRRTRLDAQTAVRVFAVEGEWAFCEYREEWRWARGYINVADLRDTTAGILPAPTAALLPAPVPAEDSFVVEGDEGTVLDSSAVSLEGRGDNFPKLAANLPVLNYYDGVPCAAEMPIYSGPGIHYWQRQADPAVFRGILDTNLRVYGQENGWLLVRYSSDIYGGSRYGWVSSAAISAQDADRIPALSLAYLPAAVIESVIASDNPDSLSPDGTVLPQYSAVTALAFLDADRNWVLCEYGMWDGLNFSMARGFLPASSLMLQ